MKVYPLNKGNKPMKSTRDMLEKLKVKERIPTPVEPLRPINDSWVSTILVQGNPVDRCNTPSDEDKKHDSDNEILSSSIFIDPSCSNNTKSPWLPPIIPTSGMKLVKISDRVVHHQRTNSPLEIDIPDRMFSPVPQNNIKNQVKEERASQTDSPIPMFKMSYGRSGCMQ
jgi:hypothetical protein